MSAVDQQQQHDSSQQPAAGRPIIKQNTGGGGCSSGLLARRLSRSRGTSTSSVTFDLALEIPHEGQLHPNEQQQQVYFSRSISTRHVHYIEQDSQLIVRECFRQWLMPRLSSEQGLQVEEVLNCGSHVESSATIGRCRQSAIIATAMTTMMTTELLATRLGMTVIRRANRVSLQNLTRAKFESHMEALVSGHRAGNSRARIGSILLFCTELALVAIRTSDRMSFCQVLNWSLDYFRKTVSAWVVMAGGWDKVTQEPTKVVVSIAFVLSVLLFGRALLRLIRGC